MSEQTLPPTIESLPEPEAEPKHKWGVRPVVFALLLIAAIALGLGGGYLLWGQKVSKLEQALKEAQTQEKQQVRRYDVPIEGNPIYGPDTAAITIIEFSDFECPYCRKWTLEVLPALKQEYGDKVRVVYRDFPLYGLHQNAASAAEAANCANEQGKFWPYHDLLFGGGESFSPAVYEKYASQISLDAAKFKQCLSENRYQKSVEEDYSYAANLGINSAPTFFINGLPVVGAQPFEVFKQIIDKELAGEIP